MGVFEIQSAPQRLDRRWTLIAELAGGLVGAAFAVLLLLALL
jgi:hypothetical protein